MPGFGRDDPAEREVLVRKRIQALVTELLGDDSDPETAPETPTTGLYTCQDCDRTYIGTAMSECPRCESPVTEVPANLEDATPSAAEEGP